MRRRELRAEELRDAGEPAIHQMEPKLPELFGLLPKSPVTVEPIPDFAKAAATHYVQGTPDGKRPGRVVVAVSNPTKRTLIDDEAVVYHEGVPGRPCRPRRWRNWEFEKRLFNLRQNSFHLVPAKRAQSLAVDVTE